MPGVTGAAATGPNAPADAPKNRPLRRHLFRGPHNDPALLREAATVRADRDKKSATAAWKSA